MSNLNFHIVEVCVPISLFPVDAFTLRMLRNENPCKEGFVILFLVINLNNPDETEPFVSFSRAEKSCNNANKLFDNQRKKQLLKLEVQIGYDDKQKINLDKNTISLTDLGNYNPQDDLVIQIGKQTLDYVNESFIIKEDFSRGNQLSENDNSLINKAVIG